MYYSHVYIYIYILLLSRGIPINTSLFHYSINRKKNAIELMSEEKSDLVDGLAAITRSIMPLSSSIR